MIQYTSEMLMQQGIMPYDVNSYLFDVNNPNMSYIPSEQTASQPLYFPPMSADLQDSFVQQNKKPKKHTFAKLLVLAGAIAGGIYAYKNPVKLKNACDAIKKFSSDVIAGAKKIINKIFKKG